MKLLNSLKFLKNRSQAINGELLICTKRKKEISRYTSEKINVEKYGVIDSQGNLVYDYQFNRIIAIDNKFLCFIAVDEHYNPKFTILDLKTKEFIIKDIYGKFLQTTWFEDYHLFLFKQEDEMVYLDLKGNKMFKYQDVECVLPSRQYIVKNDGKYGIAVCFYDDEKQKSVFKEVLHCEHESIDVLYEIANPRFDVEESRWRDKEYYNPIYVTKNVGKTKLVKVECTGEIQYASELIDDCKRNGNHRITIQKGKKLGLIDFDGKTILPCEYDSIEDFEIDDGYYYNSLAKVKKGEKVGCVNLKGELVWPCMFDEIGKFDSGTAKAKICGFEVEISNNGESKDLSRLLELTQKPKNTKQLKNIIDNLQNHEK